MDKIGCKITLMLGDNAISAKEIIDKVKSMVKLEVDYGDSLEYVTNFKDGKQVKFKLKTVNDINNSIEGGGIYFIISPDDKLLYIGKAKHIKTRLKQHLIECATSTYSHIQDVCTYLLQLKNANKKLALKYCVVNSVDDANNAAIEGALIDYVQENSVNDDYLSECWNIRRE